MISVVAQWRISPLLPGSSLAFQPGRVFLPLQYLQGKNDPKTESPRRLPCGGSTHRSHLRQTERKGGSGSRPGKGDGPAQQADRASSRHTKAPGHGRNPLRGNRGGLLPPVYPFPPYGQRKKQGPPLRNEKRPRRRPLEEDFLETAERSIGIASPPSAIAPHRVRKAESSAIPTCSLPSRETTYSFSAVFGRLEGSAHRRTEERKKLQLERNQLLSAAAHMAGTFLEGTGSMNRPTRRKPSGRGQAQVGHLFLSFHELKTPLSSLTATISDLFEGIGSGIPTK